MSKRSYSEADVPSYKRAKITPPATIVLEHADELTSCLQALKSGDKRLDKLKILCKTLLPAFTQLAKDTETAQPLDGSEIHDGDNQASVVEVAPEEGIDVPTFTMLTPWEPSQIAETLPPLPPVLDPSLEAAAFTHQGICLPGEISYERLEWIGDAYLYIISSCFIYQTFPSLTPGRSSQLRELLVKNATLCGYAMHYDFLQRAKLPYDIRNARNKDRSKVLGDMVEAYTGAIILSDRSNGLKRAARWLKAMWSISLQAQLRKEFNRQNTKLPQANLHPDKSSSVSAPIANPEGKSQRHPKEELANIIRVPGITIRYENMPCNAKDSTSGLPLFTIGVFVDGRGVKNERLGWGTALSKREAGQKAAKAAMENSKAIKHWIEWKQKYVAMNTLKPKPERKPGEANK